jgi:glutamate synthase (ferredoxin)
VKLVLKAMASEGKEAVWSMGDDTPLAALSRLPRPLYAYFKQRFAQVTNPPIDPLRETMVMSLDVLLGQRSGYLEEGPEHAAGLVRLKTPVLLEPQMAALRRLEGPLASFKLDAAFDAAQGPAGLQPAVEQLCQSAERAVDDGRGVIILSDRAIGFNRAPIPMLMAVGAVHHHLIRAGCRPAGP